MRMTVDPQQINSNYDNAYLNMLNVGGGGIGVWLGLHQQPTYLIEHKTEKNIASFITFAGMDWANEWFEQNREYKIIWKWEPEEQANDSS